MEKFEKYSIPGIPDFEIMRTDPAESQEGSGYIVQYEGKPVSTPFATAMEARQLVFLEAQKRLSERRAKFQSIIGKLDAALESLKGDDVWVLGRYQQ